MSPEQYKAFQKVQKDLADFVDSREPIDTEFGNELFQRISDAALEVYEKYDIRPDPAAEMKAESA